MENYVINIGRKRIVFDKALLGKLQNEYGIAPTIKVKNTNKLKIKTKLWQQKIIKSAFRV